MKTLIRRDFVSWANGKNEPRGIALIDNTGWFHQAINSMYDTNMGKMGDDGVYERIWIEDECGYQDDLRPASPHEVDLYLKHCDISYFGDKEEPTDKTVFAVVRGDCSYVLYDSDAVEEYRRESTKFNLP